MPSCTRLPSSFYPFILLLFSSVYLSSAPSIYLSSANSVSLGLAVSVFLNSAIPIHLSQLGFPRVASASLSSWADYPSDKLTSSFLVPQSASSSTPSSSGLSQFVYVGRRLSRCHIEARHITPIADPWYITSVADPYCSQNPNLPSISQNFRLNQSSRHASRH